MDTLQKQLRAYLQSGPYLISSELEAEGEWKIARFRVLQEPDLVWAVLVSEFIHHLRSALDNLVWQLVLLNGGEPWQRNQFPIYTEAPAAGRLDAMLRGVSGDHRAVIEELQPYNSPQVQVSRALAVLVDLSNIDKHRFLHPVLAWSIGAEKPEVRIEPASAKVKIEIGWRGGVLYDGADMYRYRVVAKNPESLKAKVHVQGVTPIEVAFSERRVGGDALEELRVRVVEVVDRFAPDFSA